VLELRIMKHGFARRGHVHPTYVVWRNMIQRCTYPQNKDFKNYGARGIRVCERWLHSFEAFLADMGHPPDRHHEIDRKDNDGNYELNNCHWVPRAISALNKRTNRRLTYNGITLTLTEWAAHAGIPAATLATRIDREKWSLDRALTTAILPPGREKGGTGNVQRELTFRGETHSITEWGEITGFGYQRLKKRLNTQGWSVERALTEKPESPLRLITFQGETLSMRQWSIRTGIPYTTLQSRIARRGWSPERALTEPISQAKPN
jgi:hypothetical protein